MIDPPAAVELRPPTRELGVVGTADVLRRFRRDHGLFAELSLAELEDLAELISPLGFRRGEILFLRGEPASWMGFLMAGRAQASLPQVTAASCAWGTTSRRDRRKCPGGFVGEEPCPTLHAEGPGGWLHCCPELRSTGGSATVATRLPPLAAQSPADATG